MSIAENIKTLRKAKGFTQDDLIKKVGCAKTTLVRYEKGERIPNATVMQQIADALDVDVIELYGIEPDKRMIPPTTIVEETPPHHEPNTMQKITKLLIEMDDEQLCKALAILEVLTQPPSK